MLCCFCGFILAGPRFGISGIDWMGMDGHDDSPNRFFWVLGIYGAVSSKNFSYDKRVHAILSDISWSAYCPTGLYSLGFPCAPALSFYRIWLLVRARKLRIALVVSPLSSEKFLL